MNITQICEIVKDNGSFALGVLIILMSIVQIAPIKINPWSSIVKWIGKNLTADLTTKVDEVEKKLDSHIKESDERDLRKRRESILDFASALANGRNYSEEQFVQMITECDSYEMFCEEKHFINSVADVSIDLIRTVYANHKANNTFVKSVYYISPREDGKNA